EGRSRKRWRGSVDLATVIALVQSTFGPSRRVGDASPQRANHAGHLPGILPTDRERVRGTVEWHDRPRRERAARSLPLHPGHGERAFPGDRGATRPDLGTAPGGAGIPTKPTQRCGRG